MPGFNLSEYEPVEDRIREFWTNHPEGRIVTELVSYHDGDYIFRAEVFKLPPVTGASMTGGVQLPDATGYAHDSADQLPVSMKSSALEVCETSAIGRALANLGYAAKGKRPSREEMSKSADAVQRPASTPAAEAHTGAKPSSATSTAAETSGGGQTFGEGVSPPSVASPEEVGAGGPDDTAPASSVEPNQEVHVHGPWAAAPRAGFVICQGTRNGKPCGYAQKSSNVPADQVSA